MTTLHADAQHSFRIGTSVMTVYDADGWLTVAPDSDGTEGGGLSSGADATPEAPTGGAPDYEMVMPFGEWSRHVDPVVDENGNPDAANAGLTITFFEGGRGYSLPLTDPRTTANLPPIGKGDSWKHAANAISGLMIRGAGSLVGQVSLLTTTDGTPAGQTVAMRCWPDQFARTAPWGTETFDINGYHLKAHDGGWRFDMGAVGGLPGPASALGSYAKLTAASITLNASAVVLGVPGPAGSYPVLVMNSQTIALFAAIVAAFESLEAQVASLSGATGPVVSPVAGAAISAIAALAAIQPALVSVSSTACA